MNKVALFVDDEPDLLELYEELFATDDWDIVALLSPIEAIEYVASHDIDVCFIDYRMPELNGVEMRAKLPATLPCYLITGEMDMPVPPGFLDTLDKPLDFERVETILVDLLG